MLLTPAAKNTLCYSVQLIDCLAQNLSYLHCCLKLPFLPRIDSRLSRQNRLSFIVVAPDPIPLNVEPVRRARRRMHHSSDDAHDRVLYALVLNFAHTRFNFIPGASYNART
jgi:hypothetical protein